MLFAGRVFPQARTDVSMSRGSGDCAIAFSAAEEARRTSDGRSQIWFYPVAPNDLTTPLFCAALEAAKEAIYNSLCMAEAPGGYRVRTVKALPPNSVVSIISKHA